MMMSRLDRTPTLKQDPEPKLNHDWPSGSNQTNWNNLVIYIYHRPVTLSYSPGGFLVGPPGLTTNLWGAAVIAWRGPYYATRSQRSVTTGARVGRHTPDFEMCISCRHAEIPSNNSTNVSCLILRKIYIVWCPERAVPVEPPARKDAPPKALSGGLNVSMSIWFNPNFAAHRLQPQVGVPNILIGTGQYV